MPNMIPVCSSNLYAVGYERSSGTLYIQFTSGHLYAYYGVPISVYDGLMNAPSHGHFHARFIKNAYHYRRLS